MCDTKLGGMSEKWQGKATIQKHWRNRPQAKTNMSCIWGRGCHCRLLTTWTAGSSAELADSHQLDIEHESIVHPCSKKLMTFCTA